MAWFEPSLGLVVVAFPLVLLVLLPQSTSASCNFQIASTILSLDSAILRLSGGNDESDYEMSTWQQTETEAHHQLMTSTAAAELLKDDVRNALEEQGTFEKQIRDLRKEIEEAKNVLSTKDTAKKELQKHLEEVEQDRERLFEQCQARENALAELAEPYADVIQKMALMTAELNANSDQIQALLEQTKKLAASYASATYGIGLTLGLAGTEESGRYLLVFGMRKDVPADLSGKVQIGDRLVRVDDMSCAGVPYEAIMERIIGPLDSEVELVFERHHSDRGVETISVVSKRTSPIPVHTQGKARQNLKRQIVGCMNSASRIPRRVLERTSLCSWDAQVEVLRALCIAAPLFAFFGAALTKDPLKSPSIKPGSLKKLAPMAPQLEGKSR
jgi:C-terminal processing protease CtpA/Prc